MTCIRKYRIHTCAQKRDAFVAGKTQGMSDSQAAAVATAVAAAAAAAVATAVSLMY